MLPLKIPAGPVGLSSAWAWSLARGSRQRPKTANVADLVFMEWVIVSFVFYDVEGDESGRGSANGKARGARGVNWDWLDRLPRSGGARPCRRHEERCGGDPAGHRPRRSDSGRHPRSGWPSVG